MTPLGYSLAWALSLVTFTFGALAFSTLAWFYWRQLWDRLQPVRPGPRGVFPVFTLVCAAAFVLNLAQQLDQRLVWIAPLLDLITGMLPPLLLHLVWQDMPRPSYAVSGAVAAAVAAADAGILPPGWADRLEAAPAVVLVAAAAGGILALRREGEPRYRLWMRVLLGLIAASAAASIWLPSPIFGLAPDYLLLAVFCVTLYYKERLVFFDVLLRRGAFFAAGLVVFSIFFLFLVRPSTIVQALFAVLWLTAPWVYARISAAVDRKWLRRRFTAAEAERRFAASVQAAESEQELCARAAAVLEEIFEAKAGADFGAAQAPAADIAADVGGHGWVWLGPRRNGMPYLSDDRHLLQSLARTLGVVLENVRYRERARQLRVLADRAELKALRAQINPHFLFNALNAIAGLIHTNAAAAEDTVEHLAEVFRYTLRKAGTEWVRLDEEIEFVTAYLRVEQARFGDRLVVELAVDPAAGGVQVPAMCVQPLVENAIKHGTSNVEGIGRVSVCASLDGDILVVEVRDNGPGFPPGSWPQAPDPRPPTPDPGPQAPGPRPPARSAPDPRPPTPDPGPQAPGHGLRNVADRLSGYYGSSAELACANGPGGAVVRLKIPRKRMAT
ncbi:MAG TPA: histidine kinase [Verrucomicrobiae bacterium]|nr:histidine kinase [Verrucomicrobiae bacterium]